MAWLIGDGFDFYNGATDLTLPGTIWDTYFGPGIGAGPNVNTTRFGVGVSLAQNISGFITSVSFANSTTIYINASVVCNNPVFPTLGNTTGIIGIVLSDVATPQCAVEIREQGDIAVTTGALGGAVIANSSILTNLSANVWNHFQIKVVIDNAAGSVEVKLNGAATSVFLAVGLNTRNGTSNSSCNTVSLQCGLTSIFWDDFYAFNDQGAAPNTWQGDIRAIQLMPNADISKTWTPNSGTTNFSRVSQLREDGDTTYVFTNTPTNADLYSIGSLITTPLNIISVQTKMFSRMDDTGPHTNSFQFKSSGTTVNSSDQALASNYTWIWKNFPLDPSTNVTWTSTAVNAIQIGPVDVL